MLIPCSLLHRVSQSQNDKKELAPTVEALQSLSEAPGDITTLLADTGYFSEANVKTCTKAEIEPLIATGRQSHNRPLQERFAQAEPLPVEAGPVDKMKHRLKTNSGRKLYAKRKSTVEPVFGIIKHVMRFR